MHRSLILLGHSKELSCCIEWENYGDFSSQLSSQVVVSFFFSATKELTFIVSHSDLPLVMKLCCILALWWCLFLFFFSKKGVHVAQVGLICVA